MSSRNLSEDQSINVFVRKKSKTGCQACKLLRSELAECNKRYQECFTDMTGLIEAERAKVMELEAELSIKIKYMQLSIEAEALRARCERLVEAASNFITGIELVHNDPEYQAVWQLYQAHIPTGYRGRKYTEVLDKLKAALELFVKKQN